MLPDKTASFRKSQNDAQQNSIISNNAAIIAVYICDESIVFFLAVIHTISCYCTVFGYCGEAGELNHHFSADKEV